MVQKIYTVSFIVARENLLHTICLVFLLSVYFTRRLCEEFSRVCVLQSNQFLCNLHVLFLDTTNFSVAGREAFCFLFAALFS